MKKPHYHGHRKRLRERFLKNGLTGFADHEVVELLLTLAIPRRDVKQPAKALLRQFGNLREILNALPSELRASYLSVQGLCQSRVDDALILGQQCCAQNSGRCRQNPIYQVAVAGIGECGYFRCNGRRDPLPPHQRRHDCREQEEVHLLPPKTLDNEILPNVGNRKNSGSELQWRLPAPPPRMTDSHCCFDSLPRPR